MYDAVCKGYMFFITFNIPLSAFIMVAVGFDRYFCICHPFLRAMTVTRAKLCLVALTLLSCALGIITSLGYGVYYLDTEAQSSSVADWRGNESSLAGGGRGVYGVFGGGPHDRDAVDSWGNDSFLGGRGRGMYEAGGEITNNGETLDEDSVVKIEGLVMNGTSTGTSAGKEAIANNTVVIYYGQCVQNQLIVSYRFSDVYQKIYAATFLFSFLLIAVLYALIYRSILIRRAWKAKRKRMSCYSSTVTAADTAMEETQLTALQNGHGDLASAGRAAAARTSVALRDRMLYANVKTAAMLFVVTVVFVISFLPSWMIGLGVMPMNYILFYLFFLNNVANPFIYAFMNRTFRDDLRHLLKRIRNRLSDW